MQRNDRVRMQELKDGDRFHFLKDKNKLVWTKVAPPTGRTMDTKYNQWALQDGTRHARTFTGKDVVIYLRSAMGTAK